jgi:hypothetical protein
MPDIIITPSTGKLEFINDSSQIQRRHSFTLDDDDGIKIDAPFRASSVRAPLNIINVTVDNSNTNYPFVLASGSAETGIKTLMMDGSGGTYNPFTNTATIDISGNSATTTLASNSTNLGGVAAASYVTLTGTQTLTNKTITGTFTGNLTGTGSWATNAVNANTATNATQLNGQAASYYTNIPARLGYTPVNQAGDTVTGNLIINGNFTVNGATTLFSASNVYISSSQLYIEDNILTLNAFSPYLRYAGVEMYDSGSGTLSSLLWDGEADYFFLTGSSVNGKIITGPDGQTNLSSNYIPKATAGYKLGNSLLYDNGTNVGIGTTTPSGKLSTGATSGMKLLVYDNAATGVYTGLGQDLAEGNSTDLFAHSVSNLGFITFGKIGTNGSTYTEWARFNTSGSLGIGTTSPNTKLAVNGVSSFGPSSKLSMIGLDINSGGTPTYIKIVTTIPVASPSADFTVNIKGFVYGAVRNADISISWHYYLSTFYNPIAKSSGGWAPTIRLSAENGFVAIVLSSPGYWPKFYVESMYSSAYTNQYASGWSWTDADATGNPIVNVPYASNFGNGFVMLTDGNVGIGITSPTTKLHVVGVISGSSFSGAGTGLTGTAASLTAGTATIANGVSTGAVKSGGLEENSVITSKIADGNVTNVKLASSSVTIGSSAVSLGSTLTTIAGLTSVTSTTFVGALTGNASTATNSTQLGGVAAASYVTLTGTETLTNKTITGTFTGNLTGNASTSTTVNGTNGQLLTKDVRTIAPNNITNGYFQFGFTSWTNNNNSPYADYLHLRSYTDSSGGNDNLVMFRKDVIGMRIWQQTFGSATNYSSYKDVCWTDGTNASGTWAITSSWATNALNVNNATLTVAAGTGISLSATPTFTANASVDKTITITNSGVTSAVAGTGVGVSGATGAVTFSIGQAVGTGNSPTFAAVTTSTDGANHIMAGTTNAEGIRMTPASSTTYPVFLRSINPGVGEASPWIYKEQATDWGIWHNNPVNSIDFTKQGSVGISTNVGGSSTNAVTVRVEMATGFVQTIAGYRNSAGTTILDNNGNITGTAAGETLSTVTGRGNGTGTQIIVATAAGQAMYIGRQAGAGYSYGSAGIFTALSDNPNGGSNIFYQGYISSSASTPGGILTYSVRADGQIYTTMNTATGIANNSFSVAKTVLGTIHIANGSGTSGNNRQAAITFQGDSATEAQAGIYVSNNNSSGTAMGFATTDNYGTGPQLFMTATNAGVVNFSRARPTYAGNALVDVAGGQTIAGITYFSNGESMNVYGIRGRFTNEYLHLYNKVGVGHPGGWGQGEGNTPSQGLSTYGGISIAYGTNATSIFYGNVGVGTTSVSARVESYYSSNAITFNYLATNLNNNSPIPVYGFDVTNGSGETRSIKAGIGYERHLTNGRGTLHFYNDSTNDTQSLSGNRTSAGDIKMSIDNDGNVGIGTTTPTYKLQVLGSFYVNTTAYINGALTVDDNIIVTAGNDFGIYDSDGTGAYWQYMDSGIAYLRIDDGGSANGKLNINSGLLYVGASGGNVGISSTTPGYKLDVVGDINFSSTLKFGGINVVSNAGGDVYLNGRVIRNESNTSQDGMYIGYNSTGTTNAHIRFFANATNERMRIQANDGNVGIGTTTAGQKLDVEGRIRTRGASGTGGFEIGAASSGAAKWRIEWDSASDSLDFNWVG